MARFVYKVLDIVVSCTLIFVCCSELQATELFIGHLAKQAHIYTVKAKRKTIQKKDIDACIPHRDELAFLEGTME